MNRDLLLLGLSSDIALHLADRFLTRGANVCGTFRSHTKALADLERRGAVLSRVDLLSETSIRAFAAEYAERRAPWDTIVSAVGQLAPIGPFFSLNFADWAELVTINSISQLNAIHMLYPMRDPARPTKVILFAGGGTNTPFDLYSAYCVGS